MKSKPATLNHTLTTKASMLEFERWFKKEFGERPTGWWMLIANYKDMKTAAKKAWQAREKVH